MSKIGIISKHVVLTAKDNIHPRYPIPAIILISNDIIEDIILLESDEEYSKAFLTYKDRQLLDCTDDYISPGIIDINVRREWENFKDLTKSAIKGGVTVIAVEEGYYSNFDSTPEYYCDIAKVSIVSDSTDFSAIPSSTNALKAYLFPPCQQIKSVANLQNILMKAHKTGLPLFIDATLPDQRMLYMASPLRLESIEDRKDSDPSSSGIFAAAFPESMESSNENSPKGKNEEGDESNSGSDLDSEEEKLLPARSLSLQTNEITAIQNRDYTSGEEEVDHKLLNKQDTVILEVKEDDECSPLKPGGKKRGSVYNIYDDLNQRIKASQKSIEDLCLAEKSTYSNSGSTSFQNLDTLVALVSPGSVFGVEKSTESDSSSPGSASLFPKPLVKRNFVRPTPILIKQDIRPDSSRDYKYHLANYPEHWECSGVERIVELLNPQSKVHFQNISSAGALNQIRKTKKKIKGVTCEIPAAHLFFTSASINNSDTRFKNTPPVRNQGNYNLLWDLLKMKGIDSISSQHASIMPIQKLTGNFQQALNGISSLGCSLQAVWNVINIPVSTTEQLEHYIIRLAKWFSLHPAKILNVESKRGSIEKGKYADLIIWNPRERFIVDNTYAYSQTSPFMNQKLMGIVKKVFLRGKVACDIDYYANGTTIIP